MAWFKRADGTLASGNNATSLAPALPAGWAAGDLHVLIFKNFGGTSARTPAVPSGWTAVSGTGVWQNGTDSLMICWRKAVGGDTAPTVTLSGTGVANDTQLARIHGFYNDSADFAFDTNGAQSTNASADNVGPITGFTPTTGALGVLFCGKTNDWNGTAELTNWTLAAQSESTTGNDAGMALLFRLSMPAGATGDLTVTDNGGTASNGVGGGQLASFVEVTPDPGSVGLPDANSAFLSRASFFTASAHTAFIRFRLRSLPAAGQLRPILSIQENTNFSGWIVGVQDDGTLRLNNSTNDIDYDGSTTLSVDTAYTLWVRVTGAGASQTCLVYLDGATTAECTGASLQWLATTGAPEVRIGYRLFQGTQTVDYGDVDVQDFRFWTADKAASGFAAEVASCGAAVDTTNLAAEYLLQLHAERDSVVGAAQTLTANGTPVTNSNDGLCATGATYTLTCTAGSFAITGTQAGLLFQRLLTANAGAVALTGVNAGLNRGFFLTASPGTVALTGTDATLRFDRLLTASPGTVALTGTQAALLFQRLLTAQPGSVAITGVDAVLRRRFDLTADPGAVALTGTDAQLLFQRLLTAQPGSVAITGTDAVLTYTVGGGTYLLTCTTGAVTITGTQAGLLFQRLLTAQPGSVALTGVNAVLRHERFLTASPGAITLTGTVAQLLFQRLLTAQPGAVALTGVDAALRLERFLTAQPGGLTLTGTAAQLLLQRLLTASPGAVAITGTDAVLTWDGFVPGTPGPHPLRVSFASVAKTVAFTAMEKTVAFTPLTKSVDLET
jgi:hypothetical protein